MYHPFKCADCETLTERINPKQKRCKNCQLKHSRRSAVEENRKYRNKPVNEYLNLLQRLTGENDYGKKSK